MAKNKKGYLTFEKARRLARSLGLKSPQKWILRRSEKTLPEGLPPKPNVEYLYSGWESWEDFLGFELPKRHNRNKLLKRNTPSKKSSARFLSFEKARAFAHSLNLETPYQWKLAFRNGRVPPEIPESPKVIYKSEWLSWSDWLNVEVRRRKRSWATFEEAKKIVHKLKLKDSTEWREYIHSAKRSRKLPVQPQHVYRKEWLGWGDWLGPQSEVKDNSAFLSFEEVQKFARRMGLTCQSDWREYVSEKPLPRGIPPYPEVAFKDEWKSWSEFLSADPNVKDSGQWMSFDEAKAHLKSKGINTFAKWLQYCASGQKPENMPLAPKRAYVLEWRGWSDWFSRESQRSSSAREKKAS